MQRMTAVLAVVAAAIGACAPSAAEEEAPAAPVRPVSVAAVVDTVIARPIAGVGVLAAKDELALAFKIGGVVAHVAVDEGDRIRAGQILAALDRREIDAAVTKARSALAKAERDAERLRRLHADSVATRVQLQDALTALDVARADLASAEFNQRYATIVAPASGTVLRRRVTPGEIVGPGMPVLIVASDARGAVLRVGLPDRDAVRVRPGDSAAVRFDAVPDRRYAGTVREIAAAPTPGTGTYAVEIALPAARGLPSGLVGRATIAAADARPVRVVPIEALVEADGDRGIVYALEAGRAVRRDVTIGIAEGGWIAVTAGLDSVTQVITDGAHEVADGDTVRVAP